jgi:hypothetical protein
MKTKRAKSTTSQTTADLIHGFEAEEARLRKTTGSHALAKACMDNPFDYALKLRTGEVIEFSGAAILNNEWVHLSVKPMCEQPKTNRLAYPAERGMDVRLADIVWVMDAPHGS